MIEKGLQKWVNDFEKPFWD